MLANKLIEQSNWPLTRSQWVKAVIRVWQIGFCFFCKSFPRLVPEAARKFLQETFSEEFSVRISRQGRYSEISKRSSAIWAMLIEHHWERSIILAIWFVHIKTEICDFSEIQSLESRLWTPLKSILLGDSSVCSTPRLSSLCSSLILLLHFCRRLSIASLKFDWNRCALFKKREKRKRINEFQ